MIREPQRAPAVARTSTLRLTGLAALVLTLTGCASFSPDGGFGAVRKAATDRLGTSVELARARQPEDQDRIAQRATETEHELERFFGSVRKHVLVAQGWAAAGLLDPTDHEAMNRLFVPVLEQTPYLSSMMVADTNGAGYLLLRDPLDPNAWMNRVTQTEAWGKRALKRRWNSRK